MYIFLLLNVVALTHCSGPVAGRKSDDCEVQILTMFKNMSIRSKMVLGGIAAVIIPFFIAGMVTYAQLSRSLEGLADEKAKQIAVDLSALAQNTLRREFNFVSAVARDPEIREAAASGNYRFIQKRLENAFHLSGTYDGSLFMTDKKGVVRADADDPKRIGTDLSNRPYFLTAKTGKANISVPVTAEALGVMGITGIALCAPIISEEHDFLGTAVIFLEMTFILGPMNTVKLGRTGHAYLADAKGSILVRPDKEFDLTIEEKEPGLKPLVNGIATGKIGTSRYSFKGVKKMAAFAPIQITGWKVVVTQNIDEIMAPVNAILNLIIFGGLIFLAVTLGSVVILSNKLSTPVQKVIETLRQVTLHSGEMVTMIGHDKRIEFVNLAMEKLMKRPSGEIIGTRPVLTSVNDISEEEIWRCLDSRNVWTGRLKIYKNASEPAILETVIIPLQDSKGQIFNYLEICRDITHELTVESRLRQAQKIEAIGTLAGGIAHDFNNILSGIFGYAELALIEKNDPSRAKKYISEVLKAAERARDLVKQILTFSRQAELELKEIIPKYIINEAIKLLRASIPSTIELLTNLKSTAVIIADPTQIHQLIINLCTNAVYAMKDNKGVINITLEDMDVDETFAKLHPDIHPGKYVLLRVSDTGCGIKPELIDHIFDPFFTTKPKGEGTGLGLSLIHGIVRKMNAAIIVTSEVNRGSTFDIIMPVVSLEMKLADNDVSDNLPHGSERIMLVDDEKQIASAFLDILTILEYKVTIFTDSLLALETLRNHSTDFDLLITDYTMPNLTGIEIAEKMKESNLNIPVILCSGYVHQDIEEASRKAGISEILRKPIKPPEMAAAIRRVLERS
jgi:signal transduction histidine kinase/CheY-like chemotaxis protein